MSRSLLCCLVAALAPACSEADATLTHTLRWHQEPGSEVQDCHVFKLDNVEPVEVDRIQVQFPAGSHHVHIYRSDTPVEDSVADCWQGIDWTRWHLVVGAQTAAMDWSLPEGKTVPLDAHQQLLVQVHWLNTTSDPIDGEIELAFHTTTHSDAHVGVVFGINKQTAMQPHERKVVQQWCPMPEGSQLLALMGHYHGLGQRYTIDTRREHATSGPLIYDALDEQTFEFKRFDPPAAVPDGEGLQFECDFFNYTDMPITWGADTKRSEHCNMVAYYYPAEELSTFCIVDAIEVRSLVGPTRRLSLGELATYTLELSEPAPSGGAVVRIAASDPAALEVPATVVVAAGQTSAAFAARALRPRRVTVSATLGSTAQTTVTTISGLVLSEVYIGTTNNQWIEIANLSNVPIDLSAYSLGAGRLDYTATRAPLAVVVPARGCVVVGGPQLTATNQPPYAQVIDFSPDLGIAPGEASGVALFDVSANQIEPASVPYDALVYGVDNNSLIGSSGELAPVVPLASNTGTYFRRAEQWLTQAVPTPGICEVQ
jgi:hypothetical protein